jgi:hypothetical protein
VCHAPSRGLFCVDVAACCCIHTCVFIFLPPFIYLLRAAVRMNDNDDEEAQLMRVIADVIEDEVEESSSVANYAKEHLEKNNNSLKVLVVLCRGLRNNDGELLLDPKRAPWKHLKASTLKATAGDYKEEVKRRWDVFIFKGNIPDATKRVPRPKNWKMDELLDWLDKHPISSEEEVSFLKTEVANKEKVAKESMEAAKAEAEMLETKRWQGEAPYLRLIHCIIDNDNIKLAFLKRHDISSSRMVVENRNSVAKRDKTVWELAAEKWNDIDFSFQTASIGQLHSDFTDSKFMFHTDVENMMPATPEKCEQKYQSMVSELNKRIEKWERSGQGDGGEQSYDEEEEEEIRAPTSEGYGSLRDRNQGALDKVHAFFEYNQSYLIYLWHMIDTHGLLGSSLQRLCDDIGATNGSSGVPSVFEVDVDGEEERSTVSTNGEQSTGLESNISGLGKFGLEAARIEAEQHERNRLARLQTASIDADQQEKNRLHERAENLRNRIHSLTLEKRKLGLQRVDTEPEKKAKLDFLSQEIDELTIDIKQKQEELESILRTPPRNNRTPESAKK